MILPKESINTNPQISRREDGKKGNTNYVTTEVYFVRQRYLQRNLKIIFCLSRFQILSADVIILSARFPANFNFG